MFFGTGVAANGVSGLLVLLDAANLDATAVVSPYEDLGSNTSLALVALILLPALSADTLFDVAIIFYLYKTKIIILIKW